MEKITVLRITDYVLFAVLTVIAIVTSDFDLSYWLVALSTLLVASSHIKELIQNHGK